MPKEGQTIETKYIDPDPRLIKYIKEKPLVQKRVNELKSRRSELEVKASKLLSAKEEKELRDIESKLIKLKSKLGTFSDNKGEILDKIIFPSMANLTFFFEAVSMIEELNFESDINELFGIRRDNPRTYDGHNARSYAFMFKELVRGMIAINEMNDEGNAGRIDFRLRLIHELQTLIFHKIHIQKILDSPKASSAVLDDILRAMAWTEMFASRVDDEYVLSKMIPKYGDKEMKDLEKCKNDKQRKEYAEMIEKKTFIDFEQHAKENIPRRSFNYDFEKLIEVADKEKYVDDMIASIKRK
jgi:hypothetical protein